MKNFLRQSPAVIEGIGRQRKQALHAGGIKVIADLLSSRPERIRQALGEVSPEQVGRWLSAARLLQVEDIGPDVAEALAEGGIASIQELADAGLQTLEEAVRRAKDRGALRDEPSLYQLAAMQREAGRLRDTGMFTGRVLDLDSAAPLAGVAVRAGRRAGTTDAEGTFDLLGLPEGTVHLSIVRVGRPPLSTSVGIRGGQLARPTTFRLKGPSPDAPSPRVMREIDGALISLGRASQARIVMRRLDELPGDTYVMVSRLPESGPARLLHLYRTKVGPEVQSDAVEIPTGQLPPGTAAGQILHLQNGALARTDLTLRDVARRKLEAIIGPHPLTVKRRVVRAGGAAERGQSDG
ncbi:MAG TPA: DUF4332 domain-containing protein [Vicinamibacteria bacterium]|nr:DUF4332 domain-containing protein [Vicinamibacteria bacterium]